MKGTDGILQNLIWGLIASAAAIVPTIVYYFFDQKKKEGVAEATAMAEAKRNEEAFRSINDRMRESFRVSDERTKEAFRVVDERTKEAFRVVDNRAAEQAKKTEAQWGTLDRHGKEVGDMKTEIAVIKSKLEELPTSTTLQAMMQAQEIRLEAKLERWAESVKEQINEFVSRER